MNYKNLTALIAALLLVGAFQNCSSDKYSFSQDTAQLASSSTSSAGGSVPAACSVTTTQEPLRIIFMVDNSTSTLTTDPNDHYRVETVQDFLTKYQSHTNLTYSFAYFTDPNAGGVSTPESPVYNFGSQQFLINSYSQPFGTAAQLSIALSAYQSINPYGNTPYKTAFATLNGIINSDVGGTSNYIVVFMSDGAPTDITSNVDPSITTLVTSLQAAAVKNKHLLTVSAVYFGPESDSGSQDHLQAMATAGGGQFVDTNKSVDMTVDDLINIPGCQ